MKKILIILLILLLFLSGCSAALVKAIYPPVDIPTEYISISNNVVQIEDCKYATIYMYYYFTKQGYEVYPFSGNLKLNNETFMQSDHIWVMVKFSDDWIAYDWGKPYFDQQHYEGYKVPIEILLIGIANKIPPIQKE